MKPSILIDLIVKQMTVMIAQIATQSGMRVPLARVADEVFSNLVSELQDQGLRQKVIADMFGLALRGYQTKVRRLEEQLEENEDTLWLRVLREIEKKGPIARSDLDFAFVSADEATLRSILRDLSDTGLVFSSGSRDNPIYIAAPDEAARMVVQAQAESRSLEDLLVVYLYRNGSRSARQLALQLKMDADLVADALDNLEAQRRVEVTREGRRVARYRVGTYKVASQGARNSGWEAAVFDHIQALSMTIIQSLRAGSSPEERRMIGGGTYSFDLWPGHPLEDEVRGLLAELRARLSDVRERVQAHNEEVGVPDQRTRVTTYCGQSVIEGYTDE